MGLSSGLKARGPKTDTPSVTFSTTEGGITESFVNGDLPVKSNACSHVA